MSLTRAVAAALLLGFLLAPRGARAQTCSFSAGPTPLSFGAYNAGAATPSDSTCTFSYSCSSARARPVVIGLSPGNGGSFTPRQMSLGTDRLNYNLYSDPTRTVIWGDGTGGSQTVSSVPTGNTHGDTLTIYGRIPAGQWVAAGSYGDTITVTLNY